MKKDLNVNFPEIQKRRRRRKFFFKSGFGLLLFGLAIFGVIRVVFYSPIFKFDHVVLSASDPEKEKILSLLEKKITQGSFLTRALGFKNFLAWPSQIQSQELAALPELESLTIEKNYQEKTVTITPVERQPSGIWCLEKNVPAECFWFNDQGLIFRESLAVSGNLIRVVSDYYQEHLVVGNQVLPDAFLSNFLSIFHVLTESDFSILEIALKDLSQEEIEVKTSAGPKIYFSLRHPADHYLAALKSLTQNPKFNRLEYVDFRIENRVYYK
ncbi:MAG: hypothetical protein HY093_00055 [Candidatus Liptonbacteria bacterium]|nr:hypothetical protein [Candidatus Liptonbacteria bacterium]